MSTPTLQGTSGNRGKLSTESPVSRSDRRNDWSAALLAPDGVALRNFVINRYLTRYLPAATVYHNCPAGVPEPIVANAGDNLAWEPMRDLREAPLSFTIRQTLSFAHLYWGDTCAMRFTRTRPMRGSWKTLAANYTGRALGRVMAHQPGIRLLEKAYFQSVSGFPEVEYYRSLFLRQQPSIVMSASHRSPAVLPPVLAAKSLGIPTATFVASWDNLTSKTRIAAPFDHYLVWSDLMRTELLEYYPHVSPEQITVVGTPQFDSYADTSIHWSRAEFFARAGLDPARPLICYSGGDAGNCPQDPEHISILLNLIRNGAIQGNPQVLLRPMPVDDGKRYEKVRREFPELVFRQPVWDHLDPGDWSRCVPRPEDIQFLANLTRHSDLNVNNESTMTLDFSINDRPVVNIAFDVGPVLPGRLPLWDYYDWEHYRPVVRFGSARFARSPEQLAEHINFFLQNPAADREGRQKLVDLQVGRPIGSAGRLIADALARLARKPAQVR